MINKLLKRASQIPDVKKLAQELVSFMGSGSFKHNISPTRSFVNVSLPNDSGVIIDLSKDNEGFFGSADCISSDPETRKKIGGWLTSKGFTPDVDPELPGNEEYFFTIEG